MKKKNFKSILILIIGLFCMLHATTVLAAGSFTISKSSATITEGKTTTFSINGSNATGRVDITSSDTSVATVSSSSEWLEGSSKTITITAKKAGTATITVKGTVADEDGIEADVTKTVKVTVKAKETNTNKDTTTDKTDKNTNTTTTNKDTTTTEKPKEKSTNAYLSTLGVTPKEYDFSGFSKTKYTYNVTVPKDVDSLKVLYKTADSNAKVKVTGNSGFEVGSDNKITIKVTAEDGKTTKTYTIKVTQLAEEEKKPGNLLEDEKGLYLTSLSIDGLELSPEFAKDTYSYTATLSDSNITELEVDAKSDNEEVDIDISGNTNLVEGENTINIVLTSEESTEQTVYQVVVTKEAEIVSTTITNTENTPSSSTDLIGSIKNYVVIAVCVIVFMIIAVIVLIILLRRENKRLNEDDEEYEDYTRNANTEEYNVYKNDENEFANNDIEKDNFIESLYKQRNGTLDEEELDEEERETLEEINRQTAKIFEEKEIEGQSVEYSKSEFEDENPLEIRRKRRGKGKHSL